MESTTIDLIKEIILYSYYIAGVILAIGIIIAGRQLKLMKKDIQDRNKRATVQKALDQLDWFATQFIPENTEYLQKLKGKKILVYNSLEKMPFIFDDKVSLTNPSVVKSIEEKGSCGIINLMNRLESFSATFTNGVADEELAFNPAAEVFCNFVETNYDCYCKLRDSSTNKYTYTIQMYELWKSKLHNYKVTEQVEMLTKSKKVFTVPKLIGE